MSHTPFAAQRRASHLHNAAPHRQHGVALVTVLVMMLLSLMLVMGGSRVGLLNERVSGNSTDYQRAFEAAEAVMADARLDLACAGGRCGARAANNWLPCDDASHADLQALLEANTPRCNNGICTDLTVARDGGNTTGNPATSFWSNGQLGAFTAAGRAARFGQFTDTAINAAQAVNPQLINNTWYWIEVLRYDSSWVGQQSFLGGQVVAPNKSCPFIYRVTVVSQGRRPGTQIVLQGLQYFREP